MEIEQEEKPSKENNFQFKSIQELFSIGYVFLILCGMLIEYAKYFPYNLNVFQYSDFLDFLIVPFKNTALVPALVIFPLVILWITKKTKFFEKAEQKEREKAIKAGKPIPPPSTTNKTLGDILFLLAMSLSVVLGFSSVSLTDGPETKAEVQEGKTTHLIEFTNGASKEVLMLGKNTNHIFYFEDKDPEIVVSTIQGNITKIKFLKKKKKK